ncbi:hypothetical protein MHH52_18585 [Paenibacillus sp. FSL K6-0276]|uniref:hypothetical protein n=1 Tax=Paenibacillus sp. FSL K6-0276 TaxID=2921450 RepID=UPI0030EB34BD
MKLFVVTILLFVFVLALIFMLDIISLFSYRESCRNLVASMRVMTPSELIIFNLIIVGTITYLLWPVIQKWLPQQSPSSQDQLPERADNNQSN